MDWRESLPEEIRAEPALADVKDVGTLAKRFLDNHKMVGASVRPPGPDAGPEARKEFREKMLKLDPDLMVVPLDERPPEDPSAYSFDGVTIPDGVKVDEAAVRATAKALGLTKSKAKELLKAEVARQFVTTTARQEGEKSLRQEWGTAYEERLILAKSTAMKLGVPEAALSGLDAVQLKAWANAAKAIGGEARQFAGQPGSGASSVAPGEALLQLAELRNRPEYYDASINPALHKALHAKALELTRAANAG